MIAVPRIGDGQCALRGFFNCGPRPATSGRSMRHKLNVRATSARLPCSGSKGGERRRVLRIAALWWCGLGRKIPSPPPATRERSAHKRTRTPSARRLRRSRMRLVFLSACRVALKKKIRGRCLAPRINSHRCYRSFATSEAARKSPCLDCVTECRSGVPRHKQENGCWLCISCATRTIVVQIRRKSWTLRRVENCRLNRVRKSSQKQIPLRLKSVRNDKSKRTCVGAPALRLLSS